MKKTARCYSPVFLSVSFDGIQAGRSSGRFYRHDRSELRNSRIVPKTNEVLKRLLADDRRRHSRVPADHVITLLALPEQGSSSVELFTAELQNISDSGVSLITDSPLQQGQIVQFCERPFYRRGIVRWVAVLSDGDFNTAGIEFINCEQNEAGGIPGRGDSIINA